MAVDTEHPVERGPTAPRPWWRPQPWELIPEVVLGLGLLFFLIDETSAATSALKSTKGLAIIVGTGVAWVALRLLLPRLVPAWARFGLFSAGAALILLVAVVPAYDEETVAETFPTKRSTATTRGSGTDGAPSTTSPSLPIVIRTGSFQGIDHRAAGTVNFYRETDGTFVVGLESFDIQPGPDYDVYVVPGADRRNLDGATRIADLRGNVGDQFDEVPAGINLGDGVWTLLVWCETFDVPIANATPG